MASSLYFYLQDPSHGWMAVPIKDILELGVENDVTPYSYMNETAAYLEEDVDMPMFLRAYKLRYGHEPRIKDSYTHRDSLVRRLKPFAAPVQVS